MGSTADLPSPVPSRAVLAARLAVGLAQGLGLYGLFELVVTRAPHPWVTARPVGFGLLMLLATLLPCSVMLVLGHARGPVVAAWTLFASGLVLLLGGYDLRLNDTPPMELASTGLLASLGAILFLGQSLVMAADASRRFWPHYADCFEAAWRAALQLVLAACFVLGFWSVYWIGSQLFLAIGLDALHRWGGRVGFVLPVTTVLAATGIHLADAGWRLTLGLRNLLLGLKGWLTPVLAGLAGAFILALPFTGFGILWGRDDGPGWLIAAAGGIVVLVSAVHGDGRKQQASPAILRLSARLASAMLPILLVLATWALARQVGAQGWTQERVVATAALVVLAVHGIFYPLAALHPGMRLLEPANIGAAFLAVVVLAALNSPIADPTRLEVESQTGRLLRGAAAPGDFDFDRLAHLGHYGRKALAALVDHADPVIARHARSASAPLYDATRPIAGDVTVAARVVALPEGTPLPPGLAMAMRQASPGCQAEDCLARAFPAAGEGAWMVGPVGGNFWVMRPEETAWRRLAIYETAVTCRDRAQAGMFAGEARPVPSLLPDLDLAGVLLRPIVPAMDCK